MRELLIAPELHSFLTFREFAAEFYQGPKRTAYTEVFSVAAIRARLISKKYIRQDCKGFL